MEASSWGQGRGVGEVFQYLRDKSKMRERRSPKQGNKLAAAVAVQYLVDAHSGQAQLMVERPDR